MQGIGLSGDLNSYVYTLIVKHCFIKFKNLPLELAGTKFPGGNVPKKIFDFFKIVTKTKSAIFRVDKRRIPPVLSVSPIYPLLRRGRSVRLPVLRKEPGQMPRNIPVHRPKARTASTPSFFPETNSVVTLHMALFRRQRDGALRHFQIPAQPPEPL